MSKLKKYAILLFVILVLGYLLSIKPDGKYLVPVAELIQKKAIPDDNKAMHTLDLEKYRSTRPGQ